MSKSLKILGPIDKKLNIIGIPNRCKAIESVLHLLLLIQFEVLVEYVDKDKELHCI